MHKDTPQNTPIIKTLNLYNLLTTRSKFDFIFFKSQKNILLWNIKILNWKYMLPFKKVKIMSIKNGSIKYNSFSKRCYIMALNNT